MASPTARTSARSAPSAAIALRRAAPDLGLWLLACAPLLGSPFIDDHDVGVGGAIAALGALVLIVARRRWPVPTLVVGLISMVVVTAVLQQPTALIPASVILLFAVAVRSDRATSIRAGVAGVAAVLVCIAILVSTDFLGPELLAGLAWPTLAVAAGDAVRSRREAIDAAEERAARAEATREEEARRRVVEERLHIARELHDVVAHQISVINVQAGAAAHLLRDRPDDAEAALATVRSSAQQVLGELSGLLGVLRSDGDGDVSTAPVPSIAELDRLVASFADTGLRVEVETGGDLERCSETTSVTVYRVVQEALTNAHKHGAGEATLRVVRHGDEIVVEVTNPVHPDRRTPRPTESGFGLLGLRERVQAVGGTVEAGRSSDDGFGVRVVLPAGRPAEAP
jgi:signal transduction histidine kinase